jgi:hypothetical protein
MMHVPGRSLDILIWKSKIQNALKLETFGDLAQKR